MMRNGDWRCRRMALGCYMCGAGFVLRRGFESRRGGGSKHCRSADPDRNRRYSWGGTRVYGAAGFPVAEERHLYGFWGRPLLRRAIRSLDVIRAEALSETTRRKRGRRNSKTAALRFRYATRRFVLN